MAIEGYFIKRIWGDGNNEGNFDKFTWWASKNRW